MTKKLMITAAAALLAVCLFPAASPAAQGTDAAMIQALYFSVSQGDINRVASLRDKGADLNATLNDAKLNAQVVFNYVNPDEHYRREVRKIQLTDADYQNWPLMTWAVILAADEELDEYGETIRVQKDQVYPNQYVFFQIVRLLLKAGASPNNADRNGTTPLHWAAWSGNYPMVKLLLANGAMPGVADNSGRTPMDWALMSGQADVVRILPDTRVKTAILDEDGDGVADDLDKCPGTPHGAPVDDRGCWVAAYANFFDFDRAVVKPRYLPHLKKSAQVLMANPGLKVELGGHTDSVGGEKYNLELGLRRARAVKKHLVKFGVKPKRMSVKSYGEIKPIASNKTAAGRAKNRRVEIQIFQGGRAQPRLVEETVVREEVKAEDWTHVPDEAVVTASGDILPPDAIVEGEVMETVEH